MRLFMSRLDDLAGLARSSLFLAKVGENGSSIYTQ